MLDQPGRDADVWLFKLGDNGLEYELVVWVNHALAARPGNTNARLLWQLHDELQARNIEIPFLQRDLWIRSALPTTASNGSNEGPAARRAL